jgi:hypothetical protein
MRQAALYPSAGTPFVAAWLASARANSREDLLPRHALYRALAKPSEPTFARADAERYRAAVRTHPELQTVLLPIGQGIELSCLWRKGLG